MYYLIYYLI